MDRDRKRATGAAERVAATGRVASTLLVMSAGCGLIQGGHTDGSTPAHRVVLIDTSACAAPVDFVDFVQCDVCVYGPDIRIGEENAGAIAEVGADEDPILRSLEPSCMPDQRYPEYGDLVSTCFVRIDGRQHDADRALDIYQSDCTYYADDVACWVHTIIVDPCTPASEGSDAEPVRP